VTTTLESTGPEGAGPAATTEPATTTDPGTTTDPATTTDRGTTTDAREPGPVGAGPLRLVHVHAHPDDESSKGAASSARYAAEGVQVTVVTCTGGEAGSILNKKMDRPEIVENLIAVRRAEMAEAARIMGVDQVWLGFVDSGLPEGDPKPPLPPGCFALVPLEESTEALVRELRRLRPHVVTTYDESGGYPHPDHIRTHEVTVAAWDAVDDPARFPDAGPAWQPSKLYYHRSFSRARLIAMHDALQELGLESPYADRVKEWLDEAENEGADLSPDPDTLVTTRVPCGDFFEVRDRALIAHATQIDPDSGWFSVPLDVQRRTWPTEDFQLVDSLVPASAPEDDLFAGLRGPDA